MKVGYIDHMGNDETPVKRARASYEWDTKIYNEEDNNKLLDRLMKEQHLWVLEGNILTVMIEASAPITQQIMRHRTMSYNARSRRYLSDEHTPFTFDIPQVRWDKGKEANISQAEYEEFMNEFNEHCVRVYNQLVQEHWVAKEIARYVIPQGMNSRFYMTGNLRNWFHFLTLRMDSHAQKEVRDIANEVYLIIQEKYPKILAAYTKYATKKLTNNILWE